MRRGADSFSALIARADAARDRRDWAVAADAYEAALAVKPGEPSIWVQLGNMAKEAGNFARAQRAYDRALHLRPSDADAHLQMGHLQKLSGDETGAMASYTLANRLDPSNASAAAELQVLRTAAPQVLLSAPVLAQAPATTQAAQPSRKPIAGRLSFNARVLRAKNALQELLHPGLDIKLGNAASLDAARPVIVEAVAALEKIIWGEINRAGATPTVDTAAASIVFDVSDLIQYFRHHRLPTGIQRVQIEVISVILLRAPSRENVRVCCFTEEADYWREVPPENFLELCELSLTAGDWTAPEWRESLEELDDLLRQSADFTFNQGAFLANIGTSWWLQNYFLKIREAQKRSNIKYAPFVHDMIPVMAPEYCVEGLVRDFVGWALGVYHHADFYFVNSEATRSDLIKVGRELGYEINPALVRTVRLDADYRKSVLKPPDAFGSLRQHRLAPRHYVLFVSTIEARKNHIAVFDAWLKLCKDHGDSAVPKLVCVGTRGWLNEAVFAKLAASGRLREKVVMLSNVSDEELAILYRECLFSVYPSFYEGWGLPVTEALCYGKPVLVSRSSALPEAGGEFVDYFELGDAADLSARLEKLIFDPSYRQSREAAIRTGFKVRSWQSIAEDLQNAISDWNAGGSTGPRAAPPIEFGCYYGFSRNTEVDLYRGLRSGELFRSGNRWWGADEWGCWLKPGPAEIAFRLPDGAGACRLYVGLRAPADIDTPFDMTILPRKKIMGVLKPGRTKWVVLEFDAAETGAEIHVVLEGFTRHEVQQRADLSPIGVSLAVIGLFVCASSDKEARVRFAEAVSLDDMTSLTRVAPAGTTSAEEVRS